MLPPSIFRTTHQPYCMLHKILIKAIIVILLITSATGYAKEGHSSFEGFYSQVGAGGVQFDTSNEVDLTINGLASPASIASSASNHHLIISADAGYNWSISPDLLIGVGVGILPMFNRSQSSRLITNGACYTFPARHTMINYSIFVSPMIKLGEDSVIYGKLGYQSTIMRENELPDFSGYLFGLGYKRFFYQSLYVFGEFNYYKSNSETVNRTVTLRPGVILNADLNSSPNLETALIGIGYQF